MKFILKNTVRKPAFLLLVASLLLTPFDSEAQCVMCKAVAEDSARSGGIGEGINSGIIYIMGIPYLLMVVAFFAFFRKKTNLTSKAFRKE